METLFKKHFWVVNLVGLSMVAWLTAQTAVDFMAAKFLTIQEPPVQLASAGTDVQLIEKAEGREISNILAKRSPFNVAETVPPKKEEEPKKDCSCDGKQCGDDGCGKSCGECEDSQTCGSEGQCEDKDEGPDETELNIELIGTLSSPMDPMVRFANLKVNGNDTQMVAIGDEVLEKATVVDIVSKMVILREGDKLTHVSMWAEESEKKTAGPSPAASRLRNSRTSPLNRPQPGEGVTGAPPRTSPNRGLAYDYSQGVKKQGDFEYQIDKSMLDEQLTDLTALGMQARVIPNYRKGKYEGFKLVGVRPGSLYRAIGIRSGDIIRSINGKAINSPNKAMELFNQLKNSSAIGLEVERRGKLENFNYTIQ